MKKLLLLMLLLFLLALPFVIIAQENKSPVIVFNEKDNPPTNYLEEDYKQVDVVVSADSKSFEIVDKIGDEKTKTGYYLYRVTALINESFKGDLTENQTIDYYVQADMGYPSKYLLGNKVIFLMYGADKVTNTRTLDALDNAMRPPTEAVIKKLRSLKTKEQSKPKKRIKPNQ